MWKVCAPHLEGRVGVLQGQCENSVHHAIRMAPYFLCKRSYGSLLRVPVLDTALTLVDRIASKAPAADIDNSVCISIAWINSCLFTQISLKMER